MPILFFYIMCFLDLNKLNPFFWQQLHKKNKTMLLDDMCLLDMIKLYIFSWSSCTEMHHPLLPSHSMDLICFLNVIEILNCFCHELRWKKTLSSLAGLVLGLKRKYSFRPVLCLALMFCIDLIKLCIFLALPFAWMLCASLNWLSLKKILSVVALQKKHSLLPTLKLVIMCFFDLIDVYNFFLAVVAAEKHFLCLNFCLFHSYEPAHCGYWES